MCAVRINDNTAESEFFSSTILAVPLFKLRSVVSL